MRVSDFLTKKFLKSLFFPSHNRGEALPEGLIRLLKKQECEVKVVLTDSGKKFVTPLSAASLSKNKVYQN